MAAGRPLILTRDEVRGIDSAAVSQLKIPGLVLMENAARGVADVIHREYADVNRRLILCGYGNNGGDGLALARQLAAVGVSSEVVLIRAGKELSDDAAANLKTLEAANATVQEFSGCADLPSLTDGDLIVDCMLGTGVRGAVRSPFSEVVEWVCSSPASVLAVDVPSGMDCETGIAEGGCVKADRTVSFVGLKQGFTNPDAAALTGSVSVAHIGLPEDWVESRLALVRSE